MLHPDIILRENSTEGRGLFAAKDIPKGTITLVIEQEKIIVYSKSQIKQLSEEKRREVMRYAYVQGDEVIFEKDNGKYMNHSCNPNVASFGPNIDIAIRDIKEGEEVTCDYSFLIDEDDEPMECFCNSDNCRKIIKAEPNDIIVQQKLMDATREAYKFKDKVEQPLLEKTMHL